MPKVSVIVPVYNVEKYMPKCIESILKQTFYDFELILIDDGSPDNCGQICDMYAKKDHRIRVIHKENGGLSSARNCGMDICCGEWICFVDSDDMIMPRHIESYLTDCSNAVDVILGNYSICDNTVNKVYTPHFGLKTGLYSGEKKNDQILAPLLICGNYMSVWRNMYRKEFLNSISLRFISEKEIFAEDDLFNVKAYALANVIKVVVATTYLHLIIKGSLSQSYRKNLFLMSLKRETLKKIIIYELFTNKYDNVFLENASNIISTCLYKESLCGFSEAKNNIKTIVNSDYTVECIKRKSRCFNKFRILYLLAKFKHYNLIIIIAKLFGSMEMPYRFINYLKQKYNL